jgi:hypothetical protein
MDGMDAFTDGLFRVFHGLSARKSRFFDVLSDCERGHDFGYRTAGKPAPGRGVHT